MRRDPAPSVPVATGTMPAATAAADPPLDPPGVSARSQGLRVTPCSADAVKDARPNSGEAVTPMGTAPAATARCTSVQVWSATRSAYSALPMANGHPVTG
ncbi:hypothetical protein AFA91_31570 [Mycolicibacterium goodii]|uniref:Uncharacterized protein n=1 Tax=Mycolicibacterium goodii TaxID=134601 RepID=A0A0K0XE89_MYCGD|nr:hypothetical protein AFA91_31570 [Mycolicibacterium goodii]